MSKVYIEYNGGISIDKDKELIIDGIAGLKHVTHNNMYREMVVTDKHGRFLILHLDNITSIEYAPQTTDTVTEIMKIYNSQIIAGSYEEQVRETLNIAVKKGLFENNTFPLNEEV